MSRNKRAANDGADTIAAYRITIVLDAEQIGNNPGKWDWSELLQVPTTLEKVTPIFDPTWWIPR